MVVWGAGEDGGGGGKEARPCRDCSRLYLQPSFACVARKDLFAEARRKVGVGCSRLSAETTASATSGVLGGENGEPAGG